MSDTIDCSGPGENFTGSVNLRVGAIFILWASTTVATLFPILSRRVPRFAVHKEVFDLVKYFGSGVIIATAFIHLLQPGVEELGSPCLTALADYSAYPFLFCMIAMFAVFIVELFAFRFGSKLANKLAYDPHNGGHHHAFEHNGTSDQSKAAQSSEDIESGADINDPSTVKNSSLAKVGSNDVAPTENVLSSQAAETLGVLILEFGIIFHSVIIGITLGTTSDFNVLFIVIIFHQMFEGLGLGTRLAFLPLQIKSYIPMFGALAYGLVTPIGLAIGLGIRHTYNENSSTANYVTGVFDSVSAGILLYAGTVELLAHEFIFSDRMRNAPLSKVIISVIEMLTGAGLMALLGKWA